MDSWKASFLRAGVYPEKTSEAMNGDGEVNKIEPFSFHYIIEMINTKNDLNIKESVQ